MPRRKRSPEENERRAKIRELLLSSNISTTAPARKSDARRFSTKDDIPSRSVQASCTNKSRKANSSAVIFNGALRMVSNMNDSSAVLVPHQL